jgi:hypothetical protein
MFAPRYRGFIAGLSRGGQACSASFGRRSGRARREAGESAMRGAWETFLIGAVTGLALIALLNLVGVSTLVFGVP